MEAGTRELYLLRGVCAEGQTHAAGTTPRQSTLRNSNHECVSEGVHTKRSPKSSPSSAASNPIQPEKQGPTERTKGPQILSTMLGLQKRKPHKARRFLRADATYSHIRRWNSAYDRIIAKKQGCN